MSRFPTAMAILHRAVLIILSLVYQAKDIGVSAIWARWPSSEALLLHRGPLLKRNEPVVASLGSILPNRVLRAEKSGVLGRWLF